MINNQRLQAQLWEQIVRLQQQQHGQAQASAPTSCDHLFQVRKKMLVCCFCKATKEY